ncbi:MAG: DeoR/GlpR family DNA-binding transcription regulator [Arenicellales bacterium]|jgi:DeoR family glycerol-3-phosphate regulon repressor|nr:DeoR family transcriptional regulator [Gammaproteobacteria bacterium]
MENLSDRQVEITALLRDCDFLSVENLSERFSVTAQTIRRDLNTLCEAGLARRRHGGVEKSLSAENLAYGYRQVLLRGEKQAISRAVAAQIPDGSSLAFSIGTTPERVAAALLQHKDLKIFTNNLNIALLMCSNRTFEVNVAGGQVRNSDGDILGPGMEKFLSSYLFDFGIYGVAGVESDGTLVDFSEREVRARELIHENSRTTILVLDHSKFGRVAHVRGGHLTQVAKIFTDREPPKNIRDQIDDSEAELIICEEGLSS